jgi:hypothetical protein
LKGSGSLPGTQALLLFYVCSPLRYCQSKYLYCTDTAVTGFKWEKAEEGRSANFKPARFTMRIETESERQIFQTSEGDFAGLHQTYTCKKVSESKVSCDDGRGTAPWVFIGESHYVRAFLAGGPPSTYADPNIAVAYGTCTKF